MEMIIDSHSEEETEALGRALGRLLRPGDVVALVGQLGAGKTCLTRGIARGLGIREPVTSPTFILVSEYETAQGTPFHHADCYRFGDAAAEAQDIGLDELMDDVGICVIEWAERIQRLLPPDHLRITLTAIGGAGRRLALFAQGARSQALLDQLRASRPKAATF